MIKHTRNKKALSINITVFGIMGLIYYIFFVMHKLETSLDHPLGTYGLVGVWIAIVGTLTVREYYTRGYVSLYKNSIVSIIYTLIYFFGFFIIPSLFGVEQGEQLITVWLGLSLVFYFITIGALHWYFGFYIALFNIAILLLTIIGNTGGEINPAVWVSIFSLAGINNIYLQWAIVLTSATLGFLEKGFDLFGVYE